ncbi:v-SNARE [Hypoxylon trugodes]|uniref:v-SNARE n=1 Tax=Hypoxylon trugodes TaxID=326681 RepID=UPI002192C774|nr:v-SNARE [Hypoxylon trugodes]KAI1388453.1 v-SNARE [Hypoxylon trugodes]
MSNPNQLYLLADHIKLSLLERQRAQSLNLDGDSKDGHISRSLDQFRDGLEALDKEQKRLEEAGDEDGALTISDALPGLQKQYNDLTSQFHGFSSPGSESTLTHPNDPTLTSDFEHATTSPTRDTPAAASSSSTSNLRPKGARTSSKTVRFTDNPSSAPADTDLEAQLFGNRYRDNPSDDNMGYRDEAAGMDNTQIHAYHQRILDQQDEQLDALGASIARQRELSMQIGDELDEHVAMLDDVDRTVDRHTSRLDRAKRQIGRISRAAGESKQMISIVILIIILVLLIAILK